MVFPKQRALILLLVLAGALSVVLFGARTLRALRDLREQAPLPAPHNVSDPAQTSVERIRSWMTVPFIARMYGIPSSVLFEALEISPRGNEEKSLTQLNEQYFPAVPGIVEAKIKAAVLENLPSPMPVP